jgi:hypothetical protein
MIAQSGVERSPAHSEIVGNFPNPFSKTTTISFTSVSNAYTDVSILDPLGIVVGRLFSGTLAAGAHTFVWRPNPASSSGMYECLVRTNGQTDKLRMMLLPR